MSLDLDLARERFESSTDFTIGLEEEFAILDPATLELEHRFEDVYAACQEDELLAESAAGELIASEVEIRSGRAETFAEAVAKQRERRARLFELVAGMGLALGAMGTHPWANYLDQRIIDTPHYNRLRARTRLGRPAQQHLEPPRPHGRARRRPGDRRLRLDARAAAAAARRLRQLALPRPPRHRPAHGPHRDLHPHLPALRGALAVPRLGQLRGASSACWSGPGSIVESTQLWWSVRPHHSFGTVEVRICDAQTRGDESFALAGLIAACIAQTALDYDEHGYEGAGAPLADREIEENLWRAIRYGAGGKMIDFRRGSGGRDARDCSSRSSPGPSRPAPSSGSRSQLPDRNGAQRAREALDGGRLDRGHLPRRGGRDASAPTPAPSESRRAGLEPGL